MSDSEKNIEGFHINIKHLHSVNVLRLDTAANLQGLNTTTSSIEFHSSFMLHNSSFLAPHNKSRNQCFHLFSVPVESFFFYQ
jgi:hypothetical protein